MASANKGAADLLPNPKFHALRNALYHTERRKFFDFSNRLLSFAIVVLGAGAAVKSAHLLHVGDTWLEIAVVVLATAQLVFDFGGLARDHQYLQRRYYELLSEMERDSAGNVEEAEWSARLLMLAGEEPMTMRAVDAIAYNKAVDAIYQGAEKRRYRQAIRWYHVRLRNVWAFQSTDFSPSSSEEAAP